MYEQINVNWSIDRSIDWLIDWFCLCISSKLATKHLNFFFWRFDATNIAIFGKSSVYSTNKSPMRQYFWNLSWPIRLELASSRRFFQFAAICIRHSVGGLCHLRLRLREDRLGLTGTLTSAWVVHPPAHAFSQGHGVSVSIIHLPHFQSRRDSTPQPWPCNRLSFRVETSHGHYPKITQRKRERWHITALVTNRQALCLQILCGRPNPSFKMRGLYFTLSSHHSRYCQLVFTLFSVFTLNHRQTSAIYYMRVCVPLPVFCFLLLQLCEEALKKFLCLTTGKLWSSAHILMKCLILGLH